MPGPGSRPPRPFSVPSNPKPGSPGWLDQRQANITRLVANRKAAEQHYFDVERHKPREIPAGTVLGGGGGGGAPQGVSGSTYSEKVNGIAPANLIGWWKMAEPSGSVSTDSSSQANNGAYTAVTLGQTGIGDGLTAASFDGSTSFNNIYSAALNTDFNGQLFTVAGWAKVSAAGVWTDATARTLLRLRVDANNDLNIARTTTDDTLRAIYVAGGTSKNVSTTLSPTAWFHWAVTVSLAGDVLKFYINGAQVGSTQTGLGTWAGALTSTVCVIGAVSTVPGSVWSGLSAHVLLYNTVLSDAQVLALATVP